VLVADDDRLFREILAESLRGQGYTVATARDGVEALHRFKSEGFDAVVTDLEMPRMRGEALAAAVKALAPGTVVIATAGEPSMDSARALLAAGCEGLLPKLSLDVSEVVKAIEAGRARQRLCQAAVAHDLLEAVRRALAAELAAPVEALTARLESLAAGSPGSAALASVLEQARRLCRSLADIQRAGPAPDASKLRAAEDAADYGKDDGDR
jgi:CheY-like chemotaxis protein